MRQIGCWKTPNGPPFQFSGIVRLFYPKHIFSPNGLPFNFFDILHVENSPRVLLSLFRHCETYFRKFVFSPEGPFNCDKNVDNFESLGYGADLGRSRLVLFIIPISKKWHCCPDLLKTKGLRFCYDQLDISCIMICNFGFDDTKFKIKRQSICTMWSRSDFHVSEIQRNFIDEEAIWYKAGAP